MPSNTITESIHEQRQVEYIVKPGDTLWQIAKEHRQDQEIRSYIAAIMKANSMNDAYIRQGDRIILP